MEKDMIFKRQRGYKLLAGSIIVIGLSVSQAMAYETITIVNKRNVTCDVSCSNNGCVCTRVTNSNNGKTDTVPAGSGEVKKDSYDPSILIYTHANCVQPSVGEAKQLTLYPYSADDSTSYLKVPCGPGGYCSHAQGDTNREDEMPSGAVTCTKASGASTYYLVTDRQYPGAYELVTSMP